MSAPDSRESLAVDPDAVPSELRKRDKWICWRYDSTDKVPISPCDPDVGIVSALDPANWSGFETANQRATDHNGIEGIGYVFNSDAPIMGVDLDHCRVSGSGTIQEWATNVIDRIKSYTEISPSGTGVHLYVNADLPKGGNRAGDVEMYEGKRFFTVTGHHVEGTPTSVNNAQQAVDDVHAEWVVDTDEGNEDTEGNLQSTPTGTLDLADTKLIQKAKNANGTGRKFSCLWRGDYQHQPSHSEARLELYNYLAFWTGKDPQRMWRLFRQSGLYPHPEKPGKCERLKDSEIRKAIQDTEQSYDPEWYANNDKLPSESKSVTADGGRLTVSDPTLVAVVEAIEELGTASTSDITSYGAVDSGKRQVQRAIDHLEEIGAIEWDRDGRSTVYSLTK